MYLEYFSIVLAWSAYCALHSLLAATRVKRFCAGRWPGLIPAYRFAYNLLAMVLLTPPLWLTYRHAGAPLWQWPDWFSYGIGVLVVLGFAWSMRWYDGVDFLGLRQLRAGRSDTPDVEGRAVLVFSPLHRHVRHPWYALGLLWLWTRDLDAAWLAAVGVMSVYLLLGSRLEEGGLMTRHGEAYRLYREKVPALLPWPGRSISADEARALSEMARLKALDTRV